ncbi:MAG: hypothetical protein ACRC1K_18345 [Planctomycetia bacterium]
MPMSTDVNLPKPHRAVFPDRCVACGVDSPGATFRAGTHAIGWWNFAFWTIGRRFTVDVPACESCAARMRRQRRLHFAVDVVAIAVGVVVAGSLLQWYQGPFKRWLMFGVVVVCLLPVIWWETLFPRPFGLTAFAETVDYEFRDPVYAAEFTALNADAGTSADADPDPASDRDDT